MATSGRWERRGAGSPRTRRLGSFLVLGLKWGLTLAALGLVAWSMRDVEMARVAHLLGALGPLALLALLPQLAAFTVETWGWRRAFRSAGHRVAYGPLLGVRIASEAVAQALPAGVLIGETLRPALISRSCGVSIAVGVGATAYRKFLKVLAHGLYIVTASFIGYQALRAAGLAWTGTVRVAWLTVGIGALLVIGALVSASVLHRARPAKRLHSLLWRLPSPRLRGALSRKVQAFGETDRQSAAFFSLGSRRTALPVIACVLSWLCEALESWLILALLGVTLRFDAVLGFDMAVSLARQTLFLLPAGIGVQEAGYMSALGAIGVPDALTVGAAFIVLKRAKEMFWIGVGLLTLLVLPTQVKESLESEAPASLRTRQAASPSPVSRPLAASAAPHSAPG